jgi:hypothetical protein
MPIGFANVAVQDAPRLNAAIARRSGEVPVQLVVRMSIQVLDNDTDTGSQWQTADDVSLAATVLN